MQVLAVGVLRVRVSWGVSVNLNARYTQFDPFFGFSGASRSLQRAQISSQSSHSSRAFRAMSRRVVQMASMAFSRLRLALCLAEPW